MTQPKLVREYKKLAMELDKMARDIDEYLETHKEVRIYKGMVESYEAMLTQLKHLAKQIVSDEKSKEYLDSISHIEGQALVLDAKPKRIVDVEKLENILGKPVTKVNGLANVKVTVPLNRLESFIAAGKVPLEAKEAVQASSISVYVNKKEETCT